MVVIMNIFAAMIGAIATLTISHWRSLNQRRVVAGRICTELQSITNHHVSNVKVLEKHASGERRLDLTALRKLVYSDKEFYATTVTDITEIRSDLALELLKFRLTMRNTYLHISDAADHWPTGDSESHNRHAGDLRDRMEFISKTADDLRLLIKAYIEDPQHEFDLKGIWSDWEVTKAIRERLLVRRPRTSEPDAGSEAART